MQKCFGKYTQAHTLVAATVNKKPSIGSWLHYSWLLMRATVERKRNEESVKADVAVRRSLSSLPVELRFAMQSECDTRRPPGECIALHNSLLFWCCSLSKIGYTFVFSVIDNRTKLASHLERRTGAISGAINGVKAKKRKLSLLQKKEWKVSQQIKLKWNVKNYTFVTVTSRAFL